MLDDLLDLLDLTGEAAPSLFNAAGKQMRKKRPAGDPGRPVIQTKGKLTARRTKHQGEDPWDWKEEKPPWEL
ncbi:hypothetical protein [uncultured Flavonifractor sp.]|uniref:hypothetical protein n=1 Tax=uncultured Flavonifractor sp. TaxID=1193534 RepID=UPI0026145466|nr:hypothetical protein [uncultured Flavonifractor sp.]